jgi:predicted metal-dependent phosphoesterase TrpH
MPWFRTDLHNHCQGDPQDDLDYSAGDLLKAYHSAGVHVVAITPHRRVFEDHHAMDLARSLGMLLIPGVEKMVSGCEVVILNVTPAEIAPHMDWQDLRSLRADRGGDLLVLAPHPFYPRTTCVGEKLEAHIDCFDAIEWCHLYGWGINPNRRAAAVAHKHGRALLANSDAHHLSQVARNRTEVWADDLSVHAIFSAIRANAVRHEARPYTLSDAWHFGTRVALPDVRRKMSRFVIRSKHHGMT